MALRLPSGAAAVGSVTVSSQDAGGFSRICPQLRAGSCTFRGVGNWNCVRAVVDNTPNVKQRAKLAASRVEKVVIKESEKPLAEYMRLPASQYSVLDAERIERVDENSFRCYAPRLKFFNFEVGPVLLVRVEEQPDGCCIRLLSCTLEGSPIVVAQNQKFTASMVNRVSYRDSKESSTDKELISDTTIQVTLEIPDAVSIIPKSAIEGTGSNVLAQVLKVMIPRFLAQLGKDYNAWATGDASRKPLGTGEL
ncbi:hypothetical protein MPTK1_8g12550 [Marchantia polymorpha subsp. ruderalis]|uniref:Uncharacterized protein n=2 Tax=Marchantia polymorpha TaxID=3197 RepID=A0A176WNT8_MARPO|nr:hypothetical protein AXG93_2953s1130 [Marchantia polymorpha subsp. ruderalis]PTQ34105.1 hypothetical protein MARPO_0083s0065 [Marchantia polymorpha]BBN19662.1 hypothetical protein Mp_8g12550 [Marchantia polymorpha subsp. ruderalis]|eukprot:PTQ34105.1 hypothetical protein MARPO_0083s0065 [Marchantia polymorpha]